MWRQSSQRTKCSVKTWMNNRNLCIYQTAPNRLTFNTSEFQAAQSYDKSCPKLITLGMRNPLELKFNMLYSWRKKKKDRRAVKYRDSLLCNTSHTSVRQHFLQHYMNVLKNNCKIFFTNHRNESSRASSCIQIFILTRQNITVLCIRGIVSIQRHQVTLFC